MTLLIALAARFLFSSLSRFESIRMIVVVIVLVDFNRMSFVTHWRRKRNSKWKREREREGEVCFFFCLDASSNDKFRYALLLRFYFERMTLRLSRAQRWNSILIERTKDLPVDTYKGKKKITFLLVWWSSSSKWDVKWVDDKSEHLRWRKKRKASFSTTPRHTNDDDKTAYRL